MTWSATKPRTQAAFADGFWPWSSQYTTCSGWPLTPPRWLLMYAAAALTPSSKVGAVLTPVTGDTTPNLIGVPDAALPPAAGVAPEAADESPLPPLLEHAVRTTTAEVSAARPATVRLRIFNPIYDR